jgi:hypothetical protein
MSKAKIQPSWDYVGNYIGIGRVAANTKSEARAILKEPVQLEEAADR